MGVPEEIQTSLVEDQRIGVYQIGRRLALPRHPVDHGNPVLVNEGVAQHRELCP